MNHRASSSTVCGVDDLGDPREVRLSDADRNAVVDRLSQAMADGRLDVAEFEQRSRQTYAAKIPSDLEGLTADLPPLPVVAPPSGSPLTDRAPASNRARKWIVSLFGDRRQAGVWDPGDQTIAFSLFGDQTLDFSAVERDEIRVITVTIFGDTRIIVPQGSQLDFAGFSLLGDVNDDAAGAPTPGGSFIRVRRYGVFGDIKLQVASD